MPGGALPADQTIEGGAQVRVTPSGFDKVEAVVAGLINDELGDGLCIPTGSEGIIDFCHTNQGACTPGCDADINIDSVQLTPETGQLRIRAQVDLITDIQIRVEIPILPDINCTLDIEAPNTVIDALVGVSTNAGSGELEVGLDSIPGFELDPDISGCAGVGQVIDFLGSLFGIIEDVVLGVLEPQLETLIGELLPDPLGIENRVDISEVLSSISPGTTAALEARAVPGGYALSERGGLSLGIIAGVNADRDPATRGGDADSEAAPCVPQLPAPALTLPPSPRGSFVLNAADPFRGLPSDPAGTDVLLGLSETFLDLAGHHAVTSGALCLRLGTEQVEQLTLGAIGLFVPSLAELGSPEGNDPLLLIARPQQAIDFDIGDGTEESPSLTLHVSGFQLDFYAFIFQRYVRGFTVSVDLNIGVNLEFGADDDGNPVILPTLVGLDAANIGVAVHNAEFLAESQEQLESFLPTVVGLALPLLAGALPDIAVPEFLGFRLESLELSRVTSSQDDFLAISATLGQSQILARLGDRPALASLNESLAAPRALRSAARGARLVRVTTPPVADIQAHLLGKGGAMPEVVIDVPARDQLGRALEWTWNLDGGMWRPFRAGGTLVLADKAFALQGRYDVQLRSRVVGDYRTLSPDTEVVPIVIDSAGPRILAERIAVEDGQVVIPAHDLVSSPDKVQLAFGSADDDAPTTAWGAGRIAVELASLLAGETRLIQAWARDELGNQSSALIDLNGIVQVQSSTDAGCACRAGASGGDAALLALAALLGLGLRRRISPRRAVMFVLLGGALAMQPACSCGGTSTPDDDDGAEDDDGDTTPACIANEDCAAGCAPGTVPICADDECSCESDVRWGVIGQYSDMDVGADGTAWVSAYNSYHGDLMVASTSESGRIPDEAWQFVDGVPDGPILVPGSDVRGGVNEPGPDVGLYTDIAVAPDGAAMVSYFDQDTGALRFSSNRSGAWLTHVVDDGVLATGEGAAFEIAGQYSAITVRADGMPGIAYFVHLSDAEGARTELRFAQANITDPGLAEDWTVSLIESAAVPEPNGDPLPVPRGVGLFVNAARLADGSPVVVYYDRVNGDLKTSRYDAAATAFTPPAILAGADADVGWYPGLAVGPSDELHVSYVSASNQDLLYLNTAAPTVELIDDGYREVGTTEGGVPLPEFHFVGDDSGVVLGADGPIVAYQDATSHELLVATRGEGGWQRETWLGNEDPFTGGYGFYIAARMAGDSLVISTWVIDQPNEAAWVEIVREAPPVE